MLTDTVNNNNNKNFAKLSLARVEPVGCREVDYANTMPGATWSFRWGPTPQQKAHRRTDGKCFNGPYVLYK